MTDEEQKPEENTAAETANEDAALEQELEQEERLPYPNARVVTHIKSQLDPGKIVRARVKKEMNEWLGEMTKRVARDMNKSPYTVVEAGDFHRSIKKYEQLEEIAAQKERMLVYLDRIKQDCNLMIGEIERSFYVGDEPKVMNKVVEEAPTERTQTQETDADE